MAGDSLHAFLRRWLRGRGADRTGGLSDAELLERFAAARDGAAFEVLVWRHGPLVLGVCRRLLRDDGDVEDVFQATFLTLVRRARSVRRGGALAAWLYRVAYRIALGVRGRGRRPVLTGQPALDSLPSRDADGLPTDSRAVLDEEVERLPRRYRTAVILYYFQGLSTAEAANVLGCPRGTVLSRLAAARRLLRARLTRRGLAPAALGSLAACAGMASALPSPGQVAGIVGMAVPFAAGQTRARGVVPERTTQLVEGALRAMSITRLKAAAAAFLLATAMSTGPAWWALAAGRAAGPADDPLLALPGQAEPLAAEKAKPAAKAPDRDREAQDRRDIAHKNLAVLEDRLRELEEAQLRPLLEARRRVVMAEEALRQAESGLADARAQASKEADLLRDLEQKVDTARQFQPKLEELRKRQRYAEQEAQKAKEMITVARLELIEAEERLHMLERRQASERDQATFRRDAAAAQVLRLEGIEPGTAAKDQSLRDLARVVEDLQREVAELRREVRRAPANRRK
jgi:RNA polymerase sigma factor (sigma-70 family)